MLLWCHSFFVQPNECVSKLLHPSPHSTSDSGVCKITRPQFVCFFAKNASCQIFFDPDPPQMKFYYLLGWRHQMDIFKNRENGTQIVCITEFRIFFLCIWLNQLFKLIEIVVQRQTAPIGKRKHLRKMGRKVGKWVVRGERR